ncbi:hypothetical protein CHUAL_013747 [Chamberlinius hualienensis]
MSVDVPHSFYKYTAFVIKDYFLSKMEKTFDFMTHIDREDYYQMISRNDINICEQNSAHQNVASMNIIEHSAKMFSSEENCSEVVSTFYKSESAEMSNLTNESAPTYEELMSIDAEKLMRLEKNFPSPQKLIWQDVDILSKENIESLFIRLKLA